MTMPPTPHQPVMLMLGDSLIAGCEWPHLLPGDQVIYNLGVPGLTTFELYQSVQHLQRYYPRADILAVMIGTNDLLMGDGSFPQVVQQILEILVRHYPKARCFVHSLLPMQVPYVSQKTIQASNDTLRAATTAAGCSYVNLYEKFIHAPDGLFQMDGVHLTYLAYQLWAQILGKQIAISANNE